MEPSSDLLAIRRWTLDVTTRGVGANADAAAKSLAGAVMRHLPARLAAAARALALHEQTIVFIDRLVLDKPLDADRDPDLLARNIAAELVRELSRRVAGGASGDGVVVYRDRAELIANFLLDLCAGRAGGQWRYAEFDGLQPLPVSAAIRTLFEAQPETALRALARLGEAGAETILGALPELEARRILALFAPAAAECEDLALIEEVWSALQRRCSSDALAPLATRQQLSLLVELLRRQPGASAFELAAAVETTLAVVREISDQVARGPSAGEGLGRDSPQGSVRGSPALSARLRAAALARPQTGPLARAPAELERWIAEVREQVRARNAQARLCFATPYGGAPMLLGLISDLRLRFDSLDSCGDDPGPRMARLLLVSSCFGEQWRAVFYDEVLRQLLGVSSGCSLAASLDWLRALDAGARARLALADEAASDEASTAPAAAGGYFSDLVQAAGEPGAQPLVCGATRLLAAFAGRVPGFAASRPAFVRQNFLACRAATERLPDRWCVRIARPPLDVVLRMTRLMNRQFTLELDGPWISLEGAE